MKPLNLQDSGYELRLYVSHCIVYMLNFLMFKLVLLILFIFVYINFRCFIFIFNCSS